MTYKQTFFFIGQCLTINHEEENKVLIRKQLESNTIDWEAFVKISTAHFVLPGVYCNFKKAALLKYLPEDLVAFMKHITHLNRERNTKIIKQALDINNILIKNGIKPIFLKGTGNVIEGLYSDIAERMTGDIDFIVSEDEYQKTIEILKNDGYHRSEKNLIGFHKHYPRLIKENAIAAIEIHKDFFETNYVAKFNYNTIKRAIQKTSSIHVLSFEDQFYLTILAYQINDNGFALKSISLRSAYDTFLLSKRIDPKNLKQKLDIKFHEMTNCYLATINLILNDIDSLPIVDTKTKQKYLKDFNRIFFNQKKYQAHINFIKKTNRLKYQLHLITKAVYKRKYTNYVLKKILERLKNDI